MPFTSQLHWSFQGERVLLSVIVLDSFRSFILACLLTIVICLLERFFTVALDNNWEPHFLRLCRRCLALWRTWIYSIVTFLRLCYMLIAMTLHLGLILTIVVTLSAVQFFIELQKLPKPPPTRIYEADSLPLLPQRLASTQSYPRSKPKPDNIFIHPTDSNIARADVVAVELGLGGDTERVKSHLHDKEEPAWEFGRGRDMARQLLAGQPELQPSSPPRQLFYITKSDDESD